MPAEGMRRAHGDPAFGVKRRNFGVECRFSVERTEGSTGGQPACEWRLGRFPWTGPITLDSRVGTPSVPGSFPETVPVDRGCCSSSCEGGRTSSAALWAPGSTRTHCISRRPPGEPFKHAVGPGGPRLRFSWLGRWSPDRFPGFGRQFLGLLPGCCGGLGREFRGLLEGLPGIFSRGGDAGFSLCAGRLKGVAAGRLESLDGFVPGCGLDGAACFLRGALGRVLGVSGGFPCCFPRHRCCGGGPLLEALTGLTENLSGLFRRGRW